MTTKLKLENDTNHFRETHRRWIKKFPFNRELGSPEYKANEDVWIRQQCFSCQYYISLMGEFELDWGVCSHPDSPLDGRIMFEHDGCEHHSLAADEESL